MVLAGSGAKTPAISFISSGTPEADAAYARLVERYGQRAPEQADVLVALGGDGLMLQVLHKTMEWRKPIYGMNRGTVGFLMNEYSDAQLVERLAAAEPSIVHPLVMTTQCLTVRTPRRAPLTKSTCGGNPTRPPRCAC